MADLPIDLIIMNPDQPRKTFSQEKLDEMAQSVKQHGIQQPIGVVPISSTQIPYLKQRMAERLAEAPEDAFFQQASQILNNWNGTDVIHMIVFGERRWRGSILAGVATIPANISANLDAEGVATMALIENMQREDVGFVEEAKAIAQWMKLKNLDPKNLKDRKKAAGMLGKTLTYISWRLDTLQLEPEIQKAVDDGKLTHHQVLNIAWLEKPEQQQTLFKLITSGKCPTSTHVEAAVKAIKEQAAAPPIQGNLGLAVQDKSKAIAATKQVEKLCETLLKMNQSPSDFDEGLLQMNIGELQFVARQLESLEKLIRSIHKTKVLSQEQALLAAQMRQEAQAEQVQDYTEF